MLDDRRIAHEGTARRLVEQARGDAIDRLARLAASLLGAPFGHVAIITDRQVIVGSFGVASDADRVTPAEDSICTVTVTQREPLVIGDARGDERVAGLPPVASGAVRAYLGVPIAVAGEVLGALCVYGPEPRTWAPQDLALLQAIGEAVSSELELGGLAAEAAETAVRLDLGFAAANIGSFDWDLITDDLHWDERLIELFGYTQEGFVPHIESFRARLHPDDELRVTAAIEAAVTACGSYDTEYRILLPDGTQRWVAARGRALCGPDGTAERLLGAAYDITEARTSTERVARVLETMSSAFYSVDHEWRFTYVNAEAEKLLARGRDDLLGRSLWEEFPAALGTSFEVNYRGAAETGESRSFEEFYPPLDGWYEVRAWPSADGLSVFFHEISDRVAAEEGRRRAVERLELLSEAGSRLSTLDVRELLGTLEDLLVPRFGAWIAIALHDDVSALLEDRESGGATTLRILHVGVGDVSGLDTMLGLVVGSAEGDDAARTVGEHVQRALRTAGAVGAASALHTVPLDVRGRVLGVVVLGTQLSEHADVRLLEDIAQRAGAALDNAVLYSAERHAGSTLQHLLLPSALPQLPQMGTAARYIAGTAGRLVGGDFYIGQELDDGRLLLVIGDVMGHGMEAAARMGQLRAVLTAYAFDGDPPDRVLERVAARAEDLLDVQMATVLVLVYDPASRKLTAASAGHLPPLLATLEGPPAFLDVPPGPPIGVGAAAYPSVTVEIPQGSTVVLYTDGLVERRDQHLDAGMELLRDALLDVRLPPDLVCDHVLAKLDRASGAPDDVALVVFSHL